MESVRRGDRTTSPAQDALVDHARGAFEDLLCGLEHEDDVAREALTAIGEDLRGTHERRGVEVVTAGVHPTGDLRGEVEAGRFLDGQRIHVRAEEHGGRAAGAAQYGGDTFCARGPENLERQRAECLQDAFGRPNAIESKFRRPMDRTSHRDEVGEPALGLCADRLGHD
jgi:hypothetical protein